jgi:hypothetical protein
MAKVDTSRFHQKLMGLERAGRAADEAALVVLGDFFVDKVVELTPKDTNRAVNGWIQAGREAGVTHRAMLPYNAASRRQQWIDELGAEAAAFERSVTYRQSLKDRADAQDMANAGRRKKNGKAYAKRARTRSYKENVRKLRLAERRLGRVREEIAKATGSENFIFFSSRFSKRNFSTVRTQIYGGTGRMEVGPNGGFVELTNREPHVRVIEKNARLGHPFTTAAAMTRSAGFAVAGNRWLEVARRRARSA